MGLERDGPGNRLLGSTSLPSLMRPAHDEPVLRSVHAAAAPHASDAKRHGRQPTASVQSREAEWKAALGGDRGAEVVPRWNGNSLVPATGIRPSGSASSLGRLRASVNAVMAVRRAKELLDASLEAEPDGVGDIPEKVEGGARGAFQRSHSYLAVMGSASDAGVEFGSSDEESEEVAEAVSRFNHRHKHLSGGARGMLKAFAQTGNSRPRVPRIGAPFADRLDSMRFGHEVVEVQRNRLWIRDMYNPFASPREPLRRYKPKKRWSLVDSIWHPRKLYGNGLDYYETDSVAEALFHQDWAVALGYEPRKGVSGGINMSKGLAGAIIKAATGAGRNEIAMIDEDGNGIHDAIDAVTQALAARCRLLYGVFDYYAVCAGSTPPISSSPVPLVMGGPDR